MKSYTDLEQSKKLAEILPIESADMWFANGLIVAKTSEEPKDIKGVFPCWSLSALLELMPYEIAKDDGESLILNLRKEDSLYYIFYDDTFTGEVEAETDLYDNFIDAAVEMACWLKKNKYI